MVSRPEFTDWKACGVILPTERFCLVCKLSLLFLIWISCQLKKKKKLEFLHKNPNFQILLKKRKAVNKVITGKSLVVAASVRWAPRQNWGPLLSQPPNQHSPLGLCASLAFVVFGLTRGINTNQPNYVILYGDFHSEGGEGIRTKQEC